MTDVDSLIPPFPTGLKSRHRRLLTSQEERALSERIRAGNDAQRRLSSGEKDARLRTCVEHGIAARNSLVEANLRLVLKHARRFAGGGTDLADLVQEGSMALLRAAEKFDGRKGFKFSTYADSWIAAYIAIAAAETGTSIRIPKKVYANIDKVRTATDRLFNRRQHHPTFEEISAESGLSPREVIQAQALVRVTSLDACLTKEPDASLLDVVGDPCAVDPSDYVVAMEDQAIVRQLIERLSGPERFVVGLIYGFMDGCPQTKPQVAKTLGLRQVEVAKLERAAIERLRSFVSDVKGRLLPS